MIEFRLQLYQVKGMLSFSTRVAVSELGYKPVHFMFPNFNQQDS